MQKSSRVEILLPLLTIILDSAAVVGAYIMSYYVRFFSSFVKVFPVDKGLPQLVWYLYFAIVTIPVWVITFQNFKMYRTKRNVFIGDEFVQIFKCTTISILLSIGIIFFFREFPYSRLVFVLIWVFSLTFITLERYFMLKLEKTFYNNRIGLKNVAIVGTNEMSDKIYSTFKKDTHTGFEVLGYFTVSGQSGDFSERKNHLGNLESLPDKIKKLKIQKLILSLTPHENEQLYRILKSCEGINVEFMLVPDFNELITSRLKISEIDGIPFMVIKSFPLNVWDRMVKRIFDILASLFILTAISPIMIILSLLVKLTSKGPLFYKQERVSLDGRKFSMLKFRSMRIDAEADGKPRFASKDDNRYTPIGLFIRKYSLDELPQFINVLTGDMSIVGPRPEREYFINIMKESVDKYLERHRVKCGITGWAQVNGLRGSETSMQARIDYDIYYIENWSLVFDIKIILKTIKEMFFSKSAF
ncbi:MAG: undecaprenyl-phosphate glucose phosphotransferase [Bacteroidetes bacterium]|nr:undecaprenyl-phosphate glucose phosphotransferase [Bacteroidota bacterium]